MSWLAIPPEVNCPCARRGRELADSTRWIGNGRLIRPGNANARRFLLRDDRRRSIAPTTAAPTDEKMKVR